MHFLGPASGGKSPLGQVLGHAAVRAGHYVRFMLADDFARAVGQTRVDNSADRTFLAPDLLIQDDFGLHKLTDQQFTDFYELIIGRYRATSFGITTNRSAEEWLGLCEIQTLGNNAPNGMANASYEIVIKGQRHWQPLSPHRKLLGNWGGD